MAAELFVLFVLFALAAPLVLWLLIAGETSNPTVVDREEAERIARERGGLDGTDRRESPDRRDGRDDRPDRDEWGVDSRWDE